MLSESLLWLTFGVLEALAAQQLALNSLTTYNSSSLPSAFTLPANSNLSISVAYCSNTSSTPSFYVTNTSSSADTPTASGGTDVYEIDVSDGFGNFTGKFDSGGVLAVESIGSMTIEIGISDDGPMHEVLDDVPFFSDSTSSQAIIYSVPFFVPTLLDPTYPKYILPDANTSAPTPPSWSPNYTFILVPTSEKLTIVPQTGCMLSSVTSSGNVVNETLWLRDSNGWRNQWLIDGLNSSTNYTTYIVENSTKVSGPIYFATKSDSFTCPLVMSLPYCPSVAYPIPLDASDSGYPYNDSTLPTYISDPLISYLSNFTTTLTTFACGRDLYSPIVTCADCQREYRTWLCRISFPRCGEVSPENPDAITTLALPPTATGVGALPTAGSASAVDSALVTQTAYATPRNTNFPAYADGYDMLLPCLEVCTAADRACPYFLGFKCPMKKFNAASSYGVGYIDSGVEGQEGGGAVKSIQDRYGNIWCNGA
ncbi:hypothetical protein FISHEDRAFT_50889 [Fistulina hepatica ATCC 64428]|uniref:FZ domain-containing protein n=1 Tax=Fistulina hepatica ATCC 64428 TaxID=1128425 RepID=A0A0D7A1S6_9AGAR|nr:hypothetical protein FISHEDRAFT_50889 [Fistulina hepatica ATCC 64428]